MSKALRLYNATCVLSLICAILSGISLIIAGPQKGMFGWLFLCFPILWALWICCVFFVKLGLSLGKLIKVWAVIDVSVLALFISFSMNAVNWTKSSGVDMVVLVSYLPFVILPWLIGNVIPGWAKSELLRNINAIEGFCGVGMGSTFALWVVVSVVTAIQSLLLIAVSRFIWNRMHPLKDAEH